MDKATRKKFEQIKKEFFANEVRYHVTKNDIKTIKNVVVFPIPGEAIIILKGDKVITVNWFAVVEFTCPLNDRAIKMAISALENIEETEKMFNRKRDPRNVEVG